MSSDRDAVSDRHERLMALVERAVSCASDAEFDAVLDDGLTQLAGCSAELALLESTCERLRQGQRAVDQLPAHQVSLALIDSAADPMWVLDETLTVIGCNEAFSKMMKEAFGREARPGDHISTLPDGVREQHEGLYRAVLKSGPILTDWVAPGSERRYDVDLRPLEIGGTRCIAVTARDSTEHHSRATELAKARDAAQLASRAAKDFLAQISHEVRTPLNAIVGLTELVRQGDLEPAQRGVLDRVQVNSRALLHLVGNVLDLSKAEAGQLDLQVHPGDVGRVLTETVEFLRPRAEAAGLEIRFTVEDEVPTETLVDTDRFRQIVTNLVDNAIRYTAAGTVVVELKHISDTVDEVIVELAVKDTGAGIPRRDHEMVFSRFFRSYRSQVDQGGGSGLGLAVTRAIVDAMEGEIRLRSAPSKGSTFRVRLPLALPVLGLHSDAPRLMRPLRVLVADDSIDNLAVVRSILDRGGHQMTEVTDGRLAVQAMFDGEPFDVVLMDVDMPVMDGVRATVEIRSREGLLARPRTPILAITAHATESVRRRCTECGMDGFLTKPLDGSLLLERLDAHGSAALVMTVSGRPAQQRVMERAVTAAGAQVVQAQTAAEALSLVTLRPHAVVVDDSLPDGSGVELVERLRIAGLEVPFVAVSSVEERTEWESIGVREWVPPPVRSAALQAALAAALAPGRVQDFDSDRAIDPELLDLMPLFLSERRKDLERIVGALAEGDLEALRDVGHRIKGTGTSYGYPELTEAGGRLEEAARNGDLEGCRAPVQAIRDVLE